MMDFQAFEESSIALHKMEKIFFLFFSFLCVSLGYSEQFKFRSGKLETISKVLVFAKFVLRIYSECSAW
jgi:hypothetical protein